ncbi:hypothetical protein F5Y15DRAFT_340811 [Xylariaceae sp. FL0016]|nr:hypothetical protein F5Y15DRAFT_340811 [Xylariaceae sp. FL0016]
MAQNPSFVSKVRMPPRDFRDAMHQVVEHMLRRHGHDAGHARVTKAIWTSFNHVLHTLKPKIMNGNTDTSQYRWQIYKEFHNRCFKKEAKISAKFPPTNTSVHDPAKGFAEAPLITLVSLRSFVALATSIDLFIERLWNIELIETNPLSQAVSQVTNVSGAWASGKRQDLLTRIDDWVEERAGAVKQESKKNPQTTALQSSTNLAKVKKEQDNKVNVSAAIFDTNTPIHNPSGLSKGARKGEKKARSAVKNGEQASKRKGPSSVDQDPVQNARKRAKLEHRASPRLDQVSNADEDEKLPVSAKRRASLHLDHIPYIGENEDLPASVATIQWVSSMFESLESRLEASLEARLEFLLEARVEARIAQIASGNARA